ncbi:hypothetical protein LPJ73_001330 [Coemansia sp. RSA 2703]|nr:hypothetical protein LPJ73_001330 [Coemansia sp. RSA 2703]KAJ2377671.1 hypothetical protein IW150_001246 [Coemansia sp. RSA 2607]KAJ2393009.1 hypothetical protein GGI05_002535 [Coemansia sp. RSA 2603]
MGRVSAEQLLQHLKSNGTYDAMRQEMQSLFTQGVRGKEFSQQALEILQSAASERGYSRLPASERPQYLSQRLLARLEAQGLLERLDTEARNFWLQPPRLAHMRRKISQAAKEAHGAEHPIARSSSRALEIDPPRITSSGRTHNYYRRGETVAAFVALGDPLCTHASYVCLAAEILACDAARNAYTILDPDAATEGQDTWAVHWDQIIVNKRAHEYAYREGEQVYAMYRDDSAQGEAAMRVTTEYYPGKVARVGAVSVAVRFDSGELAHVYYDEVFAAGKIGFLRKCSEQRRRKESAPGVDNAGRQIPSFTGFWPDVESPRLGKHGRRVRYRQPPPMLMPYEPRVVSGNEVPPSHAESAQSLSAVSDMDTASTPSRAPSPSPPRVPAPQPAARAPNFVTPRTKLLAASSDEEGEIALAGGPREEGEFIAPTPHAHHPGRPSSAQRPAMERPRRSRSPEAAPRHRLSRWDCGPEPEPRRHVRVERYDKRRSTYGGRESWRRESDPRGVWRRSPEPRERRGSRGRLPHAPYGEYDHR